MKILKGHISPETAYIVNDYPYGFRLRCKIRYWLEYKQNKGVRFCTQTTNPKKTEEVWNKPKCSTYSRISAAMYLNEKEHVQWTGLTEYSDLKEASAWNSQFREGAHFDSLPELDCWLEIKELYERLMKKGIDYHEAGKQAILFANGIVIPEKETPADVREKAREEAITEEPEIQQEETERPEIEEEAETMENAGQNVTVFAMQGTGKAEQINLF